METNSGLIALQIFFWSLSTIIILLVIKMFLVEPLTLFLKKCSIFFQKLTSRILK